jgi:hypothetical protein
MIGGAENPRALTLDACMMSFVIVPDMDRNSATTFNPAGGKCFGILGSFCDALRQVGRTLNWFGVPASPMNWPNYWLC